MMLDFYKLVNILLPHAMRTTGLLSLCRVLIASQLQPLFASYHVFRTRTRFEASVTPQVCSLEYAVERMFDVNCSISALNGLPYDFLVSIDRSTDLNAIRAFLDKHKLAGKSFIFELGDTVYSATWSGYEDEDLVEAYTATWSDYADEDDGIITISAFFSSMSSTECVINLASSANATGDVIFNYEVSYRTTSGASIVVGTGTMTLLSGASAAQAVVSLTMPSTTSVLYLAGTLSATEGDLHSYVVEIEETFHA